MAFFNHFNQNNELYNEDDCISLLAFIAQLSSETTYEVEYISRIIYRTTHHLFKEEIHKKYLKILKELSYSRFTIKTYNIYVSKKNIFKIYMLTSLKYLKIGNFDYNTTFFLQEVLRHVINCCDSLIIPPFIHVLKMTENILNKYSYEILTPEISTQLLQFLNEIASSPLTGFRQCTHTISRYVLKFLTNNQKQALSHFFNLPVKGIDLNELLKLFKKEDIEFWSQELNKKVLTSFSNNKDSRNGSFIFIKILSVYSFEEFVEFIWPNYYLYLQQSENEGELYQSIVKYWIPISVEHYGTNLFEFVLEDKNICFLVKGQILLETKKKNCYNQNKYYYYAFKLVKYPPTSALGLNIFSIFLKKSINIDKSELDAVQYFLENYYLEDRFEPGVIKSLQMLFSQIFLTGHIILNKKEEENLIYINWYQGFLQEVSNICTNRLTRRILEYPAQLLTIIWSLGTGSHFDLLTDYKLTFEVVYKREGNLLYQKLKESGFWSILLCNHKLQSEFQAILKEKIHCSSLLNLIKRYYLKQINLDKLGSVTDLLQQSSSSICSQNSELVRDYGTLIILYKINNGKNFEEDLCYLRNIFDENLNSFETEHLYFCVLILEIVSIIKKRNESTDLVVFITNGFKLIEALFENNLHIDLDAKKTKVLEAFINSVINCFSISKVDWNENKFNKLQVFKQLSQIIQKSNMKRPVLLAINVVRNFGALMEQNETDRLLKIRFLDETLGYLHEDRSNIIMTIRRNPEVRLVIHALIHSNASSRKFSLDWAVSSMLMVLSAKHCNDYSLSSTLHSLELLISDRSIHQETLKYIPKILEHCICLFGSSSWIVRNADLQLLKALIERFLGVSLHEDFGLRPKTTEDLFLMFPDIVYTFHKVLSKPNLTDSSLVVMLFFSESQLKNSVLLRNSLAKVLTNFRFLFIDLIQKYSYNYGALGVKSFASHCPENEIPRTISELSDYICRSFPFISRNIFGNLVHLLYEMIKKYNYSLRRFDNKTIKLAIGKLLHYLRRFDCFFLNLISIKVDVLEQSVIKISLFLTDSKTNFEKRIWLNNNIPFVISQINVIGLEKLLSNILLESNNVADFLQVSILNALVDRLKKTKEIIASSILNILIKKFIQLCDKNNILVTSYAKTILLFTELSGHFNCYDSEIMNAIRREYFSTNIYKTFVFVLILAGVNYKKKTNEDLIFQIEALEKYKKCITNCDDDDVLNDLSITLEALYTSSSINNRYDVIKIAVFLLFNVKTSNAMCLFVSNITKTESFSILPAFEALFNAENLKKNVFYDDKISLMFLIDIFRYLNTLPNNLVKTNTYYHIEINVSIPIQTIKTIIFNSINCMLNNF